MNLINVTNSIQMEFQNVNRTVKNSVDSKKFTDSLKKTKETNMLKVADYTEHLRSKYGNVSIRSVGRDQESLERVGRGMSGNDVIIAPNILEQMATDSETAVYYENKIDEYFNSIIPQDTAMFAAKGLVFEPGGVVVHEDGTVTYICGCSDSPERVAKVHAENKAKREAEAERREKSLECSREAAEERKQILENQYHSNMIKDLRNEYVDDSIVDVFYLDSTKVVASSYSAYERAISSIRSRII